MEETPENFVVEMLKRVQLAEERLAEQQRKTEATKERIAEVQRKTKAIEQRLAEEQQKTKAADERAAAAEERLEVVLKAQADAPTSFVAKGVARSLDAENVFDKELRAMEVAKKIYHDMFVVGSLDMQRAKLGTTATFNS
jgi:uncharacterized protein YgbK (DUF1537 family)